MPGHGSRKSSQHTDPFDGKAVDQGLVPGKRMSKLSGTIGAPGGPGNASTPLLDPTSGGSEASGVYVIVNNDKTKDEKKREKDAEIFNEVYQFGLTIKALLPNKIIGNAVIARAKESKEAEHANEGHMGTTPGAAAAQHSPAAAAAVPSSSAAAAAPGLSPADSKQPPNQDDVFAQKLKALYDKNPQLAELLKEIKEKEAKAKAVDDKLKTIHYKILWWMLAALAVIATIGEIAYEKFAWDTLRDTINGSDDPYNPTPALITSPFWQNIFSAFRAILIAGDAGANVLFIDITGTPDAILKYLTREMKIEGWKEWLLIKALFYLAFAQYAGGIVADVVGIQSLVDSKTLQYVLIAFGIASVPVYYLGAYVSGIIGTQDVLHEWFSDTESHDIQKLPWYMQLTQHYNFLSTWGVYTVIRDIQFAYLGIVFANLVAAAKNLDPNGKELEDLSNSLQVLMGVGTTASVLASQTLKKWKQVYISGKDNRDFLEFLAVFEAAQRTNSTFHKTLSSLLGIAMAYLPANFVLQALSDSWYGIILAIVAGAPMILLENYGQINQDRVEVFNKHKEMKNLYADLCVICCKMSKKTGEALTIEDIHRDYVDIDKLDRYFTNDEDFAAKLKALEPKADENDAKQAKDEKTKANAETKKDAERFIAQLKNTLNKFAKMFQLYGELQVETYQKSDVGTDLASERIRDMYAAIGRLNVLCKTHEAHADANDAKRATEAAAKTAAEVEIAVMRKMNPEMKLAVTGLRRRIGQSNGPFQMPNAAPATAAPVSAVATAANGLGPTDKKSAKKPTLVDKHATVIAKAHELNAKANASANALAVIVKGDFKEQMSKADTDWISVVSAFLNFGTQATRQFNLIQFFRTTTGANYRTCVAFTVSVGTKNSLMNAVVFKPNVEEGMTSWISRFSRIATFFSSCTCRRKPVDNEPRGVEVGQQDAAQTSASIMPPSAYRIGSGSGMRA